MNYKILMVMLLMFGHALEARYLVIKDEKQFLDELNKYEFVVGCFMQDAKADKKVDKNGAKDVAALRKTIKAAAETEPFNKTLKQQVGFLVIDMNKDCMQDLVKKYKIAQNSKPQFLLFKDGKAVHTISGDCAKIAGFIDKADILDFIGDYFGKEFDDILAEKADEQAQERQLELARYQALGKASYPYGSWAPYNPWGSPAAYIYTGYAEFYPYGYSYNGYAYFIP